jgi:microsomal dipeptidase-like Zn-dependent dipeptidase
MKNFIDIHCHSVMTHYRNQELNIPACEEIHREVFTGTESLRSFYTQSNFAKLVNGGVGAIVISLYPIEQKFLLPNFPFEGLLEKAISNITGFSRNNVRDMLAEEKAGTIHYYDDLVGEYKYLLSQVNKACNNKEIKIATNYNEYLANKQSGNIISIIISIEGAHSLGTILSSDLTKKPELVDEKDYNEKYRHNVFAMKKWGSNGSHTPFFITLGHHFWNMLVGHAESLPFIFDQKTGKETGFTPAGLKLIDDLLSDRDANAIPNKTRRVLVDVKHMSPKARKQYYDYVAAKKRTSGLNIPVICSHASVGDAPSLDYFINRAKDNKKDKNKNYFNTSSLSLNDEDIKVIIDSDGIIGIVLHEGRIAAKDAMKESTYGIDDHRKEIKHARNKIENFQLELRKEKDQKRKQKLLDKISEKVKEIDQSGQKIREGYTNMVLANMYKIVEVYSKYNPAMPAKGWDHIGIGSDFDGMINKLDYLGTANEFHELEALMIKFLKEPQPLDKFDTSWTKDRLKALQFNYSAEALAEKMMSKNADEFLRKYFNEDYLINGKNPTATTDKPLIA